MSLWGTKFLTWWKGEAVGADRFGNRYYREKGGRRRWVIYRGQAEASKVPPEWHVWLHHTSDEIPPSQPQRRPWEREHVPNLTGTEHAYRPSGQLKSGGHRPRATGDYEPWRPD